MYVVDIGGLPVGGDISQRSYVRLLGSCKTRAECEQKIYHRLPLSMATKSML